MTIEDHPPPRRLSKADLVRAFAVVVALNGLFLLSLLVAALVPGELLRSRILEGFDQGALAHAGRLPYNTSIGWGLYNDCLILQMISNEDTAVHRALGPLVHHEPDFSNMCARVNELAGPQLAGVPPPDLETYRYTRYWHGHNAVTAAVVAAVPFRTARHLFRGAAYLSALTLLGVALLRRGRIRILAAVMGSAGVLFWGLPYFGQSPGHGPGDTTVMAGFVLILLGARALKDRASWLTACAAFGACVTYMEFLTGLLPTAAAFLLPFGYFVAEDNGRSGASIRARWEHALIGVGAFGAGAAVTVVIRQALAWAAFGPQVVSSFTGNLRHWVEGPAVEEYPRLVEAAMVTFQLVSEWGAILTYGSRRAAAVLFGTALLSWVAAFLLASRPIEGSARRESLNRVLACAAGAVVVAAWIALLPTHTANHPFMARMLIAPVALGWTALLISASGFVADRQKIV